MGKTSARHANEVGRRMGRVPQRRRTISPSPIRRHGLWPLEVMIILTLGVNVFAKAARLVNLAHWPEPRMEIGRLEHHVLEAARLRHSLKELIGLFERAPYGRAIDRYMLAVFQHFHAMLCVVRRVGGTKYGLGCVVLDELFE